MKTAVVAIIFNRPDKTKILFESIKKYKPNKLFIISDGPRNKNLIVLLGFIGSFIISILLALIMNALKPDESNPT